jgi:hypothetical protein
MCAEKVRLSGPYSPLMADDNPHFRTEPEGVTQSKTRKINSLIFGYSLKRRENHVFPFFFINMKRAWQPAYGEICKSDQVQ